MSGNCLHAKIIYQNKQNPQITKVSNIPDSKLPLLNKCISLVLGLFSKSFFFLLVGGLKENDTHKSGECVARVGTKKKGKKKWHSARNQR